MDAKYLVRDDAEKWANPELADVFEMGLPISFEEWLDEPGTNAEKRAKYSMPLEETHNERTETYEVPGCPEEPDAPAVRILVTYPANRKRKMPCVIGIAGGGLILSFAAIMAPEKLADDLGAIVVSFNYRCLFDDSKYPEALNDCHAVYKYVLDHAKDLGVDEKRVLLYGVSSGGHLALALCHRLKRHNYHPRGCIAIGPVADNRLIYPSSVRSGNTWNSQALYRTGKEWLGDQGNDAFLSPEAFPNHATVKECEELAPTIIYTYETDVCLDPSLMYASKLVQAGVFTQLYLFGGQNHICNCNAYLNTPDSEQAEEYRDMLKRDADMLVKNDLRRLWQEEE